MGVDVDALPEQIFTHVRTRHWTLALEALSVYPDQWLNQDADGHTLLHWSALMGKLSFVREAVRGRSKVDAQSNTGQTPLMWSVIGGNVSTARLLLEAEANLQCHDSMGATPLMMAVQHPSMASYRLMQLLIQRGGQQLVADMDVKGCTTVHWAAWKGDLKALKVLDSFGANLLALDKERMSPLHRACMTGQEGVMPFLLEMRADPLQCDAAGRSCIDIQRACGQPVVAALGASSSRGAGAAADPLGLWGGGDFVEAMLRTSGMSWLNTYCHSAVSSLVEVVGVEQEEEGNEEEEEEEDEEGGCEGRRLAAAPDLEPLLGSAMGGGGTGPRSWDPGADGL